MKTEWDYTELAEAYLKRPDYSESAIHDMLAAMKLPEQALVCDIGAGVAHLTLALAQRSLQVYAVEPNDAMRALGQKRTAEHERIKWFEGTGENSGQQDNCFDLVSFGSSFNVTDRAKTLIETVRILKPGGWFACMWNHRDLEDPLQVRIETLIKSHIQDYHYGTRREDQRDIIQASGLFAEVAYTEGKVLHQQTPQEVVTAWRSHATLHRQAGESFHQIIAGIESLLQEFGQESITIPYITRIWYAQKLPG